MAFDPPVLTPRSSSRSPFASILAGIARQPLALWIAFVVVHAGLAVLIFANADEALGDVVNVYEPWARLAQDGEMVVGITTGWVYPIGALVPIFAPIAFGAHNYALTWLAMVTLLNAGAFAVLVAGRHRRNLVAAWWWLAFTGLLGPIALSRLDSVAAPIVVVALLWLALRERLAVVLLTIATWIKVWPAAVLLSLMIAMQGRWRLLGVMLATSLVFVILALTYGSGSNVFSFVTMQTGRGMQIEAPIATPWMWAAAVHAAGVQIYFDTTLLTFQITGRGTAFASSLMTPLLALAVVVVSALGIRAIRHHASVTRVLPELVLAFVLTLIVFNKVGSPQYMTWLVAPTILGLVYQGRAFRTPALMVLAMAGLTQLFYPWLYDWILVANPVMLGVLTLRNVFLCVLLAWSIQALWSDARAGELHIPDLARTAVWPFKPRPTVEE